MKALKIKKIFYSLQGEGANIGTPAVFVRFAGCSAKSFCETEGIKCDTDWKDHKYSFTQIEDLRRAINRNACGCKTIIWTGGEPTDQLTDEICLYFKAKGYFQFIETSGIGKIPKGIDYISISPKVPKKIIDKNFKFFQINTCDGWEYVQCHEVRYVVTADFYLPDTIEIAAKHYFLSPMFDGDKINYECLAKAIEIVKQNPTWKLSVQMHKLIDIE